jgi:hypothetical protein
MHKLLIQELRHAREQIAAHEMIKAGRHIAVALCLYESSATGTFAPEILNTILQADQALTAREMTLAAMALDEGLRLLKEQTQSTNHR